MTAMTTPGMDRQMGKAAIIVSAVAAAVLASSVAQAQSQGRWEKEPERIFGIQLGTKLSEAALPPCPVNGRETELCLYRVPETPGISQPPVYLRGHAFDYVAVTLVLEDDGTVGGLVARLDERNYLRFREALNTRYGPPTSDVNESVQSRAGATYGSNTARWVGQRMSITAYQRLDRVDSSAVLFQDNASAERERAKRENRAKREAGAF